MIEVKRYLNEDIESLISRFRKKVKDSGLLRMITEKSYYEKPSDRKRRKMNRSKHRKNIF